MNGEPQMQFSMLNDISKVAAIKATSALSKMLKFPIGVDVVPVETKSVDHLNSMMKPQEKVVGLSVPILGPLPGTCLLIYTEKSAYAMCDAMFKRKEGATKVLADDEVSALTESANIVVGNFLSSFAIPLQIDSLMHRAANLDQNDFSNFIKEISPAIIKKIKEEFLVEIAFRFQHIKIHGIALFVFGKDSMAKVMKKVNTQ